MGRLFLRILAGLAAIMLAAPAMAQTTRPADDQAWKSVVDSFAEALAQGDSSALLPLLGDDVAVRALDAKSADAVRLLGRVRGGMLVMAGAYPHVPESLASEVAVAFKTSRAPEPIKARMVPPDEAQMRRANQIARQWVRQILAPREGEPLGVIVFVTTAPADKDGKALAEVIFVLVKGSTANPSHPRIQSIVFGDPQKQVK